MTGAVRDRLEERGIRLKRYTPGEHRAPCPECARGARDDALAVRIEPDGGATWTCHRCQWADGFRPERREIDARLLGGGGQRPEPWRQERPPEPEQHVTLSPWGLDLWQACRPIEPGTPAARYLEHRCCIVPPGDLRWHPELEDKASGYRGPALVGLVTDALTCEPINLHRTWLTGDGSGKAPIDTPRRPLKGHRTKGGVIRLWPDEEVTLGLVVGEGIETCLAAAAVGLVPVWSTISAYKLGSFPVLPGLEGITILVDHDKPNPNTGKRAGTEAAIELIERYAAAGFNRVRDIHVWYPPIEGEDVNDMVRRERRGAA
jgi:hypothetical protein